MQLKQETSKPTLQTNRGVPMRRRIVFSAAFLVVFPAFKGYCVDCVECHAQITPNIVADWKTSAHAGHSVACASCHSDAHTSAEDSVKAALPTADTCAQCHKDKFEQFSKGKHAKAWKAMKAMPTLHWQPMALIDGMKGCGVTPAGRREMT